MEHILLERADRLFDAQNNAHPIDAEVLADLDLDHAYAIQRRLADRAIRDGRRQIGWKVGLTSAAAMRAFGATEPMAGRLFDDRRVASGSALSEALTCAPRIEGEILLEIGTAPAPDSNDDALLDSLVSVRVAIEVADSRIIAWPSSVEAAVADNACSGWVVIGSPVEARSCDLAEVSMTITANTDLISRGRGADCLGNPLASYRWFLNKASAEGWSIGPGELLLTGALGLAVPMRPDTLYEVAIGGLGTVTLHFKGQWG